MSREVVRCRDCRECAVGLEIGFTGATVRRCMKYDEPVEADDGCTKGSPGDNQTMGAYYDVIISPHEAVYGW